MVLGKNNKRRISNWSFRGFLLLFLFSTGLFQVDKMGQEIRLWDWYIKQLGT